MTAIIDYGVGNLFSLCSSFDAIGEKAVITGDEKLIRGADRLLLPGVGAFGDAAAQLRAAGLDQLICEEAGRGKPLLGVCLGMQLLLDRSFEYGEHPGLGLIPGEVRPIAEVIPAGLKIPHIGWNALLFRGEPSPLFRHIRDGAHVYFVHSFHGANCRHVIAAAEYGGELTAAVAKDNVFGCQFHPEKSGSVGLNILRAFCEMK